MEYPIEIEGVETKALHCQLYKKLLGPIYTAGAAVFVLAALWSIWQFRNNGELFYGILSALYLVFAVWMKNSPKRIAKKSFTDKLRYYNGTMPTSTVRFGENITQEDVDSNITIPYDKVLRVDFLPDCIAVTTAQKKTYGFPNRDFTKGSMAELKVLLREKRPDLKIPE